ncbi:MAG: chromosomal replication initiator protein DnaA [Myxococcota bacterium]
MDQAALWDSLLTTLLDRIGPQNVEIWLRTARLADIHDGVLHLEVVNAYYRDWISEHYQAHLEQAASELLGAETRVEYRFRDERAAPASPTAQPRPNTRSGEAVPKGTGVNAHQTFASFVVGECNKFAHAASSAVADSPTKEYNPLFIYGATGLGKTHLMHAIGNKIQSNDPSARVVYVTSEDFMNDMIRGLRYKRMEEFRNKYRKSCKVLLVDDIQFLSGRDRTQEEFFHTFNALQNSGRQIVLTSDVEPRHIDKLEDRLRTRFEGGLLADMQAPDPETLLAILWQKADALRVSIPNDLADVISNKVAGNIRELEGVLKRLAALQTFYQEPLTLEFARSKLPAVFAQAPASVTVPGIIEAVARFHSIRSADITGKKRTRTLTDPRHIAMYLARRHTSLSFPELGREFGGRDHSTVQHGFRKVERGLTENPDLAYKIRLIEQSLSIRSG